MRETEGEIVCWLFNVPCERDRGRDCWLFNVPCEEDRGRDCLFVGCLTSQQQASVSQGRICSDNFTCCHAEVEPADQTVYLTQSQYTDTGPTSPSADPIMPRGREREMVVVGCSRQVGWSMYGSSLALCAVSRRF